MADAGEDNEALRLDRGIVRYHSIEEALGAGLRDVSRGRDVSVRSAAANAGGGLKVLVDDVAVAFIDLPPLAHEADQIAELWASLIVG